ncbi:MAG: hypothetical protein QUV19_01895 [Alteromonas macleodii]|uniref:hypothetical protein n=1 Tax=Alteromonas TaxID=226 RepID=UPI001E44F1C1|nr:hypothetical protein [Alteromonas macleodii]MDM7960935.1 hypothetical protein [Alteromonas macleodii]MDM8169318.1 hypothetical protein [Alteromonas macleodii]
MLNNLGLIPEYLRYSDSFCQDICTNHPDYSHRGEPDTLLGQDTVFGSDFNEYTFSVSQNEDGSLLAYKRIIISD